MTRIPENQLQRFREHFQCSQEALAATLNVSVRTISRWERASIPDLNPFLSVVWATATRHSAHLYKYAHALLPPELLQSVQSDLRERSILIGPEAVVVAMSPATKMNWGIYSYFEGISVAAFMDKDLKALLARHYDEIRAISHAGNSSRLVHIVTKNAPPGSVPPLWRKHLMRIIYPLVHETVSHRITEKEYTEANEKLWFEDVDVSRPTVSL